MTIEQEIQQQDRRMKEYVREFLIARVNGASVPPVDPAAFDLSDPAASLEQLNAYNAAVGRRVTAQMLAREYHYATEGTAADHLAAYDRLINEVRDV